MAIMSANSYGRYMIEMQVLIYLPLFFFRFILVVVVFVAIIILLPLRL